MYYILCMANILPKDKQIAVISMLAEGSSIRAVERIAPLQCAGSYEHAEDGDRGRSDDGSRFD